MPLGSGPSQTTLDGIALPSPSVAAGRLNRICEDVEAKEGSACRAAFGWYRVLLEPFQILLVCVMICEVQLCDSVEGLGLLSGGGTATRCGDGSNDRVEDKPVEERVGQQIGNVNIPYPALIILDGDAIDNVVSKYCLD
jgi:hypothetical protein